MLKGMSSYTFERYSLEMQKGFPHYAISLYQIYIMREEKTVGWWKKNYRPTGASYVSGREMLAIVQVCPGFAEG